MSTSQRSVAHTSPTRGRPAGPGTERPGATTATGAARKRPGSGTDAMVAVGALAAVLVAVTALVATGTIDQFLSWAWERHANVLSWYIRPLFVLPLALFSYRRSPAGIVLTLIAVATSIFWFPAPAQVDPTIAEFLAFERQWLTSGWTPDKIAQALLTPAALFALCLVFWKRSLVLGLVVINAMALGKVAWGVIEGEGTGWAMQVPAVVGLVVCDAAVLYAMSRLRTRAARRHQAASPART